MRDPARDGRRRLGGTPATYRDGDVRRPCRSAPLPQPFVRRLLGHACERSPNALPGRLRHPRCYVATAVSAGRTASIAEGALVRGAIDIGRNDLGELVATAVYRPAGATAARGGYYRVRDTGIRCVRAPCFSYSATQVNGPTSTRTSGVDLAAANPAPNELARAQKALHTTNGLYARGGFSTGLDGGRTFHATRLFLRTPLPRA